MKKRLHIIYITGLGDRKPDGQRKAIRAWRFWGVEPEMYQVNWGDKEPWEPKFKRLLKRIDDLTSSGNPMALVGISAGASAVVNAFAARKDKLVGAVFIAGKINRPAAIDPRHNIKNPAFVTSVKECQQALASLDASDRSRLLSLYALGDELVKKSDSYIPGAKNRRVPSFGHFITIATQITLGAPFFIRFLKRHQKIK